MRFIPTWVHGIIDYIEGVALLLAPNIFGFAELGGPAVLVPRILGVMILVYSLITRYELGAVKLLPMPVHLVIDFLGGLFLAVSPWIFGFAGGPSNVWAPHVVVGVMTLVVVILSQTEPQRVRRTAAA